MTTSSPRERLSEPWQLTKLTDSLRAQPIYVIFFPREVEVVMHDNLNRLIKMGFKWALSPYWNEMNLKIGSTRRRREAGDKSFLVNTHACKTRQEAGSWLGDTRTNIILMSPPPVSARCISFQFGPDLFLHLLLCNLASGDDILAFFAWMGPHVALLYMNRPVLCRHVTFLASIPM